MPNTGAYLNDLDLASLDFEVEDIDGVADAAAPVLPTMPIPGLGGSLVTSGLGITEPREITLVLATVTGHRAGFTAATARARLRTLAAVAGGGLCEIRTALEPAVCYAGYLASFIEEKLADNGRLSLANTRVRLRFICPDAYGYDKSTTALGLGAVAVAAPLGSAPSRPVIYIQGPGTNPSLVLRRPSGQALCTMGFTITLAAGDWLKIDAEGFAIRKSVSGSESDGLSTWTTAADGFVILDPCDGDPVLPAYPTLEVSGLTAGGSAEALYRRQYR